MPKLDGKLEIQGGNDYIMPNSLNVVWVTVGNIAIEIKRMDTGVVVDLWPANDEDADLLATCSATNPEV